MNDVTPYQATIINELLIVIVSTAHHKQALLHTSIVDFVDYVSPPASELILAPLYSIRCR